MFIIVGFTIALICTISTGSDVATIAAVQTGLALGVVRILAPDNILWSEAIQLRIEWGGVTVVRPSGRSQDAGWAMFDDVRIKPIRRARLAGQRGTWRITLMNARKAAISSFINMDADQVLFMFPLELAIDATDEEMRALQQTLAILVEG